ncbi:MFS transporter [Methanospirillum purgamenti]|uniref:MFS transporter n=1 Tax=Methanospirillum hungatei TaxID=2203 RepID=A0A8F5VMA9_METHU|nr:MFS transporter [Methanospirillum hungatei]QXO95686.1 MFS transporter [Methanospirillum hungatei]
MSLTDRAYIIQLSVIGFLAIFSTTISKNPVLPLYASSLGANDALIGLISAISPLAGILLSFPVGVISDRLGRRRMLLFAGGVFLTAPLLYLFIADPLMLIPVRFFHGMATAILGPVISAIIAERFSVTKGERIGQYSSATLYGRTLAPLVGGLLISFFAITPGIFRYQSVYLAAFIAGLIVCLLIFRIPGDKKGIDVALTFGVFVKSLQIFWADSRLRATAYVDMGTYFVFGAFETFFPVYLVSQGFEAYLIGIFFAVQVLSIALTKPFFGKMADKKDPRYQIMAGLMLLGVSVFLIPFCSTIILLFILTLASGLGMSLSTVATTKYIADIARKEEMGASMGALSSIMDIGHSSGPFVTGVIITASGYGMGFLSGLLLALVITIYFGMMTVTRKKVPKVG